MGVELGAAAGAGEGSGEADVESLAVSPQRAVVVTGVEGDPDLALPAGVPRRESPPYDDPALLLGVVAFHGPHLAAHLGLLIEGRPAEILGGVTEHGDLFGFEPYGAVGRLGGDGTGPAEPHLERPVARAAEPGQTLAERSGDTGLSSVDEGSELGELVGLGGGLLRSDTGRPCTAGDP